MVTVKGTLIDYFNNRPIISTVTFQGHGNGTLFKLEKGDTDDNGFFKFTTRAAWSGKYYLNFHSKNINALTGRYENYGHLANQEITDGKTLDYGSIIETTHTFYCMVTVNNTSGIPYDFIIYGHGNDNGVHLRYPVAPNSKFVYYVEYSKWDYINKDHNFVLDYHLQVENSSQQGGGTVKIPILDKDTVYGTINF